VRQARPSLPEHRRAFGRLLGNAVTHQICENCIYAHVLAAKNAGATREKILEAAGVAVLMQGGPTYTYLPRLVEAVDALWAPSET
jgi:alkylhydroperoxidase/carboxymuconolactone decarboxylase family protein YurZ